MNWKQELKRMKLDSIQKAAPGFFDLSGGHAMKVKPYKDDTANGLTKCIVDWINFDGGHANRVNTQGQVRKERIQLAFGNSRDIMRYTRSTTNLGTADVLAIIKGKAVSIEIKIGKDSLSKHQLAEQDRVTRAGGLYFVATDMQSFVDWYKTQFVKITAQ